MSVQLGGIVLDAPDPGELADFYAALLGWERYWADDTWVMLREPGGNRPGLSFAKEPLHARPSWPSQADEQQMQLHLDFLVDDLAAETDRAVALGATLAALQPQAGVRVLIDPVGHPFCLFVEGA